VGEDCYLQCWLVGAVSRCVRRVRGDNVSELSDEMCDRRAKPRELSYCVVPCAGHCVVTPGSTASSGHQTWNWVIRSPGQWVIWVIFHVRVTGSLGHHFDPV